MSTYESTWRLKFDPNSVNRGVKDVTENLTKAVKQGNALGDCFKRLKAIDLMAIDNSVQNIKDRLQGISDIAIKNESALAEVSSITGVVGKELDKLNDRAKGLSRTYGEDLNVNLDSFKTILSRLGPDMGKSDKAMGDFGESVNILAKGMEGDITGATDAITTSMLQFQIDLKNPIKAAEESKRIINVMAAGAKEGAAEIPSISDALVEAGVSAKLANLSFEETNASIQAMAQGGKYGSEAGVAIRNIITNISASTALSKEAVTILKAYGISTKKMGDTTIAWADRLKLLKPIQNDINALTAIFGRENAAAAQILIRSADYQADLTKKITGTNVAYEQAAIIMNTQAEEEKRRNQRWNLFKLQIGNVTKEFQPYINVTASVISITANAKNAYDGLALIMRAMRTLLGVDIALKWINTNVTKKLTKEQLKLSLTTNALKFSMLWASLTTFGFAGAMQTLKTSINSVSMAIMKIPLVGWILALIAVLIAAFAWLWNNVGEFRGFFYGIWNVIKLVFTGIWEVIKVIVGLIVLHFKWWWDTVKIVFNFIVGIVKDSWNWVAAKFEWAWNFIKIKALQIWDTLKSVFGKVKDYFVSVFGFIWNWVAAKFHWAWGLIKVKSLQIWDTLKSVFVKVKDFFKSIFGGVWDVVSNVFEKIWNKIKGFMKYLEPLGKALGGIWDRVKGAFNKGMEKGVKEIDEKKRQEAIEKGLSNGSIVKYKGQYISKTRYDNIIQKEQSALNVADTTAGADTPTKTIDYDKLFAKKDKKKKKKGSSEDGKEDGLSMSGSKGNRTINQTININNYFSAAKQSVGKIADEIAAKVNDRLRDGMVALD